jgi:DNA-directed RNA polymerase specialized sigma24 family protein
MVWPLKIGTQERAGTAFMSPDGNLDGSAPSTFPMTHWSLIVRAGTPGSPQARAALEELCSAYWYPLYAFIRRKGNPPDRAHDLTQDFFARILEKDLLISVDRGKGRFRGFLQVACKNFLIDAWRERHDVTATAIPIDARAAEGRYAIEPADNMTAERLFDRAWTLTLLERVLGLLAAEYAASGRDELFDQLKVVLTEGKGAVRAAELAARLGISEEAVYTASHRLRKRYREILQEQIVATLDDPSELADEIRSLFDALRTESAIR